MKPKTKSTLLGLLLIITVTSSTVGLGVFFHNTVAFRGTITYISYEGGFYGITSDADWHYEPTNLPAEFREDGLRVFVFAQRKLHMGSAYTWGEIIEIRSIRLL